MVFIPMVPGLQAKHSVTHNGEAQDNERSGNDVAERTDWLVRYQPWLRLLARLEIDHRFAGKFSASDVAQQTMAEAWKGWDEFRGEHEAQRMAWLKAILRNQMANLARNYVGTQKRDVMREVSLEASLDQSEQRLNNLVVADQTSPSGAAIANERQLQLAQALERLPADYCEVIVLRNLEELSHEEVAARMNRKSGAVRMLWVRALTRLKEELGDESG